MRQADQADDGGVAAQRRGLQGECGHGVIVGGSDGGRVTIDGQLLSRTCQPVRTRALLPPVDPQRFVPTRERPVRAKSRHLEQDTEITPHSHAWAQVVVCASGVARITAGHSTYLVPAWRAVWIPPHIEHLVTVVEAAELRTLYVHQEAGRVGPGVPREAECRLARLPRAGGVGAAARAGAADGRGHGRPRAR